MVAVEEHEPGAHVTRRGRVIALPGALASAGVTVELTGEWRYTLSALAFKLVTAGGGGSRQAVVALLDSTGAVVYAVAAPGVQAGGETVVYSFAPGVVAFGNAALGYMGAPLPGAELPENLTVAVTVAATEAADALSDVRLLASQRSARFGD